MNRYKKLFSDTVVLAIGTFGSKLLVFVLMPLYTAWLTTAEYGAAELLTSAANLLLPIACVGVSTGIFRFAAEKENDQKKVLSTGIFLLLCGLLAFLLLSPLLSLIPYLKEHVWLLVAYVFFADIQAVFAQYVRATDRVRLFAVQGIFNTLVTVLFNVLFLSVLHWGVVGYVLSVVVGNFLTTVLLLVCARLWREIRFSAVDRRVAAEMLRFSVPMIPTTVCWLITDLSDRYMVTYFCGESINGIYSAAYKIPTVVNLLSGIFLQAWQFSAVVSASDEQSCSRFYTQVYRGFLSVTMMGTAALIFCSEFLTGILLNKAYHDAAKLMPTLLCAAALEALVSFLATVYMVRKKSMHSFVTAIMGSVCNVVFNLILIPRIGAIGAALATLLSYAVVLAARLADVPRLISFRLYLPRMCANVLLLLMSCAAMSFGGAHRMLWCLVPTLALMSLNAPCLVQALRAWLGFRKKGSGEEA